MGEVDLVGLKPDPDVHCFLQCFDTVDRVKPVPDMTYSVFSGTFNPAQSVNPKGPLGMNGSFYRPDALSVTQPTVSEC